MVAIHPVHEFSTLSFGVVGVSTKAPFNSMQEIDDVGGDVQKEMYVLQICLHQILQMIAELCDDKSRPKIA